MKMRDKKVPLSPTRRREARARKIMASLLTSLRTKRSLTLADCAGRAKITPQRLERIEGGAAHLYLNDLWGLAKAFRLRPWVLMKRIDDAVAAVFPPAPRRKSLQRAEAR